MKKFKKSEIQEVQAVQFGVDKEANSFVQLCEKDNYTKEIRLVYTDLLGEPENAFNAVKTNYGWQAINKGDWIVNKNGEIFVIPDGCFKAIYEEVI